jgi:hypothetical protein
MDKADVGEMVLAHDWPVVMQQQHVEIVNGKRKEFDLKI